MPNQVVPLTDPQRLAALLQSTDQNQVMPQQPVQMSNPGDPNAGMQALGMQMLMKKYGGKMGFMGGDTAPDASGIPGVQPLPLTGYNNG